MAVQPSADAPPRSGLFRKIAFDGPRIGEFGLPPTEAESDAADTDRNSGRPVVAGIAVAGVIPTVRITVAITIGISPTVVGVPRIVPAAVIAAAGVIPAAAAVNAATAPGAATPDAFTAAPSLRLRRCRVEECGSQGDRRNEK